jgi:acyl-CoA thioesterase
MTPPLKPTPFLDELGFKVESAAEGRCRISAPVTPRLHNPYGSLHGGITYTLADTGMGIAAYTLLAAHERTTTLECSIRYLRPATSGRIVAECRVIRRSNRFAITEAEVFDEAGEVVAVVGGTFYISRSKT